MISPKSNIMQMKCQTCNEVHKRKEFLIILKFDKLQKHIAQHKSTIVCLNFSCQLVLHEFH
jgi:hypothetical protein